MELELGKHECTDKDKLDHKKCKIPKYFHVDRSYRLVFRLAHQATGKFVWVQHCLPRKQNKSISFFSPDNGSIKCKMKKRTHDSVEKKFALKSCEIRRNEERVWKKEGFQCIAIKSKLSSEALGRQWERAIRQPKLILFSVWDHLLNNDAHGRKMPLVGIRRVVTTLDYYWPSNSRINYNLKQIKKVWNFFFFFKRLKRTEWADICD